jgi:hypothetical protein
MYRLLTPNDIIHFESNPFVKAVEEHIRTKSALAEKWLGVLA